MPEVLGTERLILRQWRDADRAPFARMNADPRVMEFFPRCLQQSESDGLIDRIEQHFLRHGFGLYASELRANHSFAGFIGLSVPDFDAPFLPAVEIGWRLAFEYWGQGLAIEGAREVLRFGFQSLGLTEVVSFTTALNLRSIRVMEKLGMVRDRADDFEHPKLKVGDPLRPHVLYRASRARWIETLAGDSATTLFPRTIPARESYS